MERPALPGRLAGPNKPPQDGLTYSASLNVVLGREGSRDVSRPRDSDGSKKGRFGGAEPLEKHLHICDTLQPEKRVWPTRGFPSERGPDAVTSCGGKAAGL
jgi:hypothetical protein